MMMGRVKKIVKMFLIVSASIVVLVVMASTINNRIGNCSIEGEIKGLGTRLALVTGGNNARGELFFKLILVINGKFSFNVKLDKSGGGRLITRNMLFQRASGKLLWMRSKIIQFDIEPDESILINGSIDKYSVDYLITGNKVSEQRSKFIQENNFTNDDLFIIQDKKQISYGFNIKYKIKDYENLNSNLNESGHN